MSKWIDICDGDNPDPTKNLVPIVLPNGYSIELLSSESGNVSGIGAVRRSDGILLRDSGTPWWVHIRTPEAILLTDCCLQSRRKLLDGGEELEFALNAVIESAAPMEWMLHEVRPRIQTRGRADEASNATVSALLKLEVYPVHREIPGQETATGFSYRWHYQSERYPIYKLMERSSWELDGAITGNTLLLRNAFSPSVATFENCSQVFSTEWYLPTASNPSVFQFLPWQTGLEGFTLTSSADKGAIITWATDIAHIRSLFEKNSGKNVLTHWHEHCGDLTNDFVTSPIEVLFLPGVSARKNELANLYLSVKETVKNHLHAEAGLKRDRVTPYGVIEEWGPANLDKYREQGVPKLLSAGVQTIFLANHFENNMNTYGVSNMCCTVDWRIARSIGGEVAMRSLCARCKVAGARVEMWGNTALSTFGLKAWENDSPNPRFSPLPKEDSPVVAMLKEAEDPFVRNAAGHIECDHYAPDFAQLNLRDPVVLRCWNAAWQNAHENIGIDGIFLDSSFNMTSDKFHWVANPTLGAENGGTIDQTYLLGQGRPRTEPSPAVRTQYHAHLEMVRAMQAMGYSYTGEDIGVFGVHRAGPGIAARLDNLFCWADSLCVFDIASIHAAGKDPDEVFFRGLSYRMMWMLYWDTERNLLTWSYPTSDPVMSVSAVVPTEQQIALLRAFGKLRPVMESAGAPTVLANRDSNEAGVIYHSKDDPTTAILWTFCPLRLLAELPLVIGATNLLTDETHLLDRPLEAWQIYHLKMQKVPV